MPQQCQEMVVVVQYRLTVSHSKIPPHTVITRDHSFSRQILPNSAAPFAKFRGSPRPPTLESLGRL